MKQDALPVDTTADPRIDADHQDAQLHADAERLDLVMRATNEGLWDWDLRTNEVYFSPRWKEMLGYAEHELPNRFDEWEQRVHPDDLPAVRSAIDAYLTGASESYEIEHRLRRRDGDCRWICARGVAVRDEHGMVTRLVGSHADISERKSAEQALEQSRRQHENLVNAVNGIVWEADASTMQFTFVSEKAEQLVGYPTERWITEPTFWLDHLHPDDREWAMQFCIDAAREKRDHELEYRMVTADGRTVWLREMVTVVVENDAAIRLRGVMVDITRQKTIEHELRRRDAILEAVRFAAERFLSPDKSWDESVNQVLERLGRAAQVSRVYIFQNYTGPDGEVWATNTHEWVVSDELSVIDLPQLKALSYKDIGFGRWVNILRNGETLHSHTRDLPAVERAELESEGTLSLVLVPIFVDGEWWGFIGFDECVRERDSSALERAALKAAADTLGAAISRSRAEEASSRLAAIVESSDDAIIGETLEGTITSWNRAAEQLFGYQAQEVIGQPVSILLPPGEALRLPEALATFERGKRLDHYETERVKKDGARVAVSIAFSPVRDAKGTVIGAAAIMRDISRQKHAEAKLQESQRSMQTLLSNLPGMAYRCLNQHDWRMEFISEGATELTGYTPGDLEANRVIAYGDLVHPDDRAHVWQDVQDAVAEDRPFRITYRISTAAGAEKWVMEQGRGVRAEDGQLEALEGIITDVTDRVQARHELERRVEERTRELSTLLSVSTSVASTLELEPLLSVILEQFRQVVDHCAAAIFSLDGTENLQLLDYRGPMARTDLDWTWRLSEVEHSREVIRRMEPVIIPDVRADTSLARSFREKAVHDLGDVPDYISSWMGVPLIYRDRAIGLLAVDSGELDAYTPRHAELALAFATQAAVAIENARLYEEAQGKAVLEERQRLARELHDSVSQALFGIGLGARTARTLVEQDPEKAVAPLDYVLSLAEAGLTEMRALIFELRPEALEQEGLSVALEKQVAALRARYGIVVESTLPGEFHAPQSVQEALYRIAQEALHNTVKHARATKVELRLGHQDRRATLVIADDGAGFDVNGSFPGHLGLRTMRERAEKLGGTFHLESSPGNGARIEVSIPCTMMNQENLL